jgi:hypothetical protein
LMFIYLWRRRSSWNLANMNSIWKFLHYFTSGIDSRILFSLSFVGYFFSIFCAFIFIVYICFSVIANKQLYYSISNKYQHSIIWFFCPLSLSSSKFDFNVCFYSFLWFDCNWIRAIIVDQMQNLNSSCLPTFSSSNSLLLMKINQRIEQRSHFLYGMYDSNKNKCHSFIFEWIYGENIEEETVRKYNWILLSKWPSPLIKVKGKREFPRRKYQK